MNFKIENTLFEIDQNSVKINNKKQHLNEKTHKALLLFLNSTNKIISKDKLFEELWGAMVVTDDSLFKVIQDVRKTLTQAGLGKKALINVYGKGYKIEPVIKLVSQQNENTVNYKNSNSRFNPLVLIIIPILLSIIVYKSYKSNPPQITQEKYLALKEMVSKRPKNLENILTKDFLNKKLSQTDKLCINYLKAYAALKKGDFKESTRLLEQNIKPSNQVEHLSVADSYYLLGWINTYTNKPELMKSYIDLAKKHYTKLNAEKGLTKTEILEARYYIVINDFDKAISSFKVLLDKSQAKNDTDTSIWSYMNLADIYELKGNNETAIQNARQALELALKVGKGQAISHAYGILSTHSMKKGDFVKAMSQASETVRYAMKQESKNLFQQSFSSFYNILTELGHLQLAEKYLNIAINYQESKNSDGHLTVAEINQGILYLKQKKYAKAEAKFERILNYSLTQSQLNQTTSWLALTRYYLEDNISSFTLAKEIYQKKDISDRNKFIAGISLIFAALELERNEVAHQVFKSISKIKNDNWLSENYYYYLMATDSISKNKLNLRESLLIEKKNFQEKLALIKNKTQPSEKFLTQLDNYITSVFMQ